MALLGVHRDGCCGSGIRQSRTYGRQVGLFDETAGDPAIVILPDWFEVVDEPAGSRLPECPGTAVCAGDGALDLGEVSVYTVGQSSSLPAVTADAAVETVTFRKPNPAAVLRAACALAALASPQLVCDESATAAFVVWPGEEPGDLQADWPW
ncbi:hypothetical protein AB0J72_18440 [Dactylosporangium sp. NPDC049742]|uniref:hypothetical protein n=1 Tax=Dactylosporangium sp. NPDC049742 TaxID=3154737 RepID=UPI0034329354